MENDKEYLSDPEGLDEYTSRNVFWVLPEARQNYLQRNAKQSIIGKMIDDAIEVIERDNQSLKGVIPTNYFRASLDNQRLGELIDLIRGIELGTESAKSRDLFGRVYEYFLGQFADADGKKGGQFYRPKSIVQLLVEMIESYKGRVLEP